MCVLSASWLDTAGTGVGAAAARTGVATAATGADPAAREVDGGSSPPRYCEGNGKAAQATMATTATNIAAIRARPARSHSAPWRRDRRFTCVVVSAGDSLAGACTPDCGDA